MATAPALEELTTDNYNDWPNDAGVSVADSRLLLYSHATDSHQVLQFQTDFEQKTPTELIVSGTIPSYAAGILYRTGPGRYKVDTAKGNTFKVIELHHIHIATALL